MNRLLGLDATIDRRRLLGGAGVGAFGLTAAALVGCSSDGDDGPGATASNSATSATSSTTSATATADPNAPKRGGIAVIDAVEPNFALLVTSVTNVVATMQESMFDRLMRQGANYAPELSAAEAYEWNDDFTKLTVTLKPGLEFHDGKSVTADTIRETIEWFVSDKSGANQVKQPLSDVATNVIDERTIEITTPEPRPWLDDTMTLMWIVDVETIDTIADAKVVNGSGPFKFKSYTPQVGYELERFEKYHVADQPYLDGITAKILPDQSARDLAIQTGDIQWMRNVPFSSVKTLTNADNISVQIVTPGGMSGVNTIGMVVDHPALADPRVRLAFAYALDVDQIASDWTDGIITEGWRWPWAPGSAGDQAARDAGVADAVSYDPEKAKELWAEADKISPWEGTFQIAFNSDGGHQEWVDAVTNQISKNLGIEASGAPYPTFAQIREEVNNRSIKTAARSGWQADYPGLYNFLGPLYATGAGSNDGDYSNPEFDAAIKASLMTAWR